MLSSTPNPFVRGFDNITSKRELLITYDDSYAPCYRKLLPHQEAFADEDIVGHSCFFDDSHALLSEPEAISAELSERYPADGTVRTVVYPVRAMREDEEVHLADTESPERAQALIDLLSFETGFYSRSFEISCAHLPEDDWDEMQDLIQLAETDQLHFECFMLPESDALGFKLLNTPWSKHHLNRIEGYGLSVLQAKQRGEGFPEAFVHILGLAGQADVRFLIIEPNGLVLKGLPVFEG